MSCWQQPLLLQHLVHLSALQRHCTRLEPRYRPEQLPPAPGWELPTGSASCSLPPQPPALGWGQMLLQPGGRSIGQSRAEASESRSRSVGESCLRDGAPGARQSQHQPRRAQTGRSRGVGSLLSDLWGSPCCRRGLWWLGQAKREEEAAAGAWRYLPDGEELMVAASQEGDFWPLRQWRSPDADQVGENIRRKSRRRERCRRRAAKPCEGTMLRRPLVSRRSQHETSAPRASSVPVPAHAAVLRQTLRHSEVWVQGAALLAR